MTQVLGIDPGSRTMGYGIVKLVQNQPQFVVCGCLNLGSKSLPDRLVDIFHCVSDLVKNYQIDSFGIENVFVSKNTRSALVLGHARGSAIVAARLDSIPIFEFSPREIKQAITGTGSATKEQVQYMVKTLLHLEHTPPSDAADALAVAMTTITHMSSPSELTS
ncbi:MAG: crossover junction endodeoxyribonuclease RuvC [Gammaproteobacteria bacterium]|nr:crossover junction endodeoxyribonuclease RuvC [Gammaproteobacteria bacterium]